MALNLSLYDTAFFSTFEESVVYKPRNGSPRRILAVVDRNPPEALPEIPGRSPATVSMIVEVKNSTTEGIGIDEYQQGDKLELPVNDGGTPEDRIIGAIVSQDSGNVSFEVR
jgi:hypothetical protein